MNHSRCGAGKERVRGLGVGAAVVAWVFLAGSYAHAQVGGDVVPLPSTSITRPDALPVVDIARGGELPVRWAALGTTPGMDLRGSPGSFDFAGTAVSQRTRVPGRAASPAGAHRSTSRNVLAGVIGAAAGFVAGAYLGAAIEGQGCACDDPGMRGAMIGAPIGAVVGGVLGVKLY